MALDLEVSDSDGEKFKITLTNGWFSNSYRAEDNSPLDSDRGSVSGKGGNGLSCFVGGYEVIAFVGLDWKSKRGESGGATCSGCDSGCSSRQTWVVV